jgi:CBS domain-containing protein
MRIPPDSLVEEAVTLMLANDFSQLPVMTSERDVKGIN